MKHFFKQNAGLTLIELVVAMAIATVVTAAAASVLFFGLRINRQTGDTASQQITVSTLLNTVEGIISEGNITEIETNTDYWRIVDKNSKVLLSYLYDEEETGAIFVGDYRLNMDDDPDTNATPILTEVLSSYVELYDGLVTVSVETKEGVYTSTVFCRLVAPDTDNSIGNGGDYTKPGEGEDLKTTFLNKLKSQYNSRGEILGDNGVSTEEYFSEWYINLDYDDEVYDGGWNERTPWCACYISWALAQAGINGPTAENPRWFANVDTFKDYFETQTNGSKWIKRTDVTTSDYEQLVGSLIFFDWIVNSETNAQHVGVVLKIEEGTDGKPARVFTIEGNSSGRVAVRSYTLTDKRIIGYGVLPWQSES